MGKRTVDGQLRVADDLLDLAVGLEVLEGFPGERTVDLETIDEGGNGDQAVRLDILVELVGDVLVEDDGVLGLVLDYIIYLISFSVRLLIKQLMKGICAPFPLDHFFFCFFAPVFAGAILSVCRCGFRRENGSEFQYYLRWVDFQI